MAHPFLPPSLNPRHAFAIGAATVFFGCGLASSSAATSTPGATAQLRVEGPADPVRDRAPHSLVVRLTDEAGAVVSAGTPKLASESPNVLEVGVDGRYVCLRSGEARISVSVGALVERATVRCEIATSIRVRSGAPVSGLTMFVGAPAVPLRADVLDADGRVIDNAPLEVTSADPSVANVRDFGVVPTGAGATTLALRSGEATSSVRVRVVDVAAIEVPPVVVAPARTQVALPVRLLDHQGAPLSQFWPNISSDNAGVASFLFGATLATKDVGAATLTVSAGRTERRVRILVFDESRVRVRVPDNQAVRIPLDAPGVYEVHVQAKAGANGVTVAWEGASCTGSGETQDVTVRCSVGGHAALIVENPTLLGLGIGAEADGWATITRYPAGTEDLAGAVRAAETTAGME